MFSAFQCIGLKNGNKYEALILHYIQINSSQKAKLQQMTRPIHAHKNHTCSHLMRTLHLYHRYLSYCRKRVKAYSPFPPLLND